MPEVVERMPEPTETSSFTSLAGLQLTPEITAALAKDGIVTPTSVQRAAVGPILTGRNVVIESGTGTGKTLAYVLPILQRLRDSPSSRAVCFAPATELAVQTKRVLERYKDAELKTAALVASGNQRLQLARLERSTRVIVGTPGRILEMYEKRKVKGFNIVVLDEPEPLFTSRDAAYLREVLSRPDPKLQLIVVGATFGSNTERFIRESMGPEVVRTKVDDDPLRKLISHRVVHVHQEGGRDFVLARFLTKHRCKRAIVFANQSNLVRHLYRYLNEQGTTAVSVTHDRTKLQCEQAMREFVSGKAMVLLTTDRAAAGLDLPALEWVLHFELPASAAAYVHRAGRTGRAGGSGTSVVFATKAERIQLLRIESELNLTFRTIEL